MTAIGDGAAFFGSAYANDTLETPSHWEGWTESSSWNAPVSNPLPEPKPLLENEPDISLIAEIKTAQPSIEDLKNNSLLQELPDASVYPDFVGAEQERFALADQALALKETLQNKNLSHSEAFEKIRAFSETLIAHDRADLPAEQQAMRLMRRRFEDVAQTTERPGAELPVFAPITRQTAIQYLDETARILETDFYADSPEVHLGIMTPLIKIADTMEEGWKGLTIGAFRHEGDRTAASTLGQFGSDIVLDVVADARDFSMGSYKALKGAITQNDKLKKDGMLDMGLATVGFAIPRALQSAWGHIFGEGTKEATAQVAKQSVKATPDEAMEAVLQNIENPDVQNIFTEGVPIVYWFKGVQQPHYSFNPVVSARAAIANPQNAIRPNFLNFVQALPPQRVSSEGMLSQADSALFLPPKVQGKNKYVRNRVKIADPETAYSAIKNGGVFTSPRLAPEGKRLFFVPDLHGAADAVKPMFERLNQQLDLPDPDGLTRELATMGDYINKGPDGYATVQMTIDLLEHPSLTQANAMFGNHELWMHKILFEKGSVGWYEAFGDMVRRRGGNKTIASYAKERSHYKGIPLDDFIKPNALGYSLDKPPHVFKPLRSDEAAHKLKLYEQHPEQYAFLQEQDLINDGVLDVDAYNALVKEHNVNAKAWFDELHSRMTNYMPEEHLKFFANLGEHIEEGNTIGIHAGWNPKAKRLGKAVPLEDQGRTSKAWIREEFLGHQGLYPNGAGTDWGSVYFYGHTIKETPTIDFQTMPNGTLQLVSVGLDAGAFTKQSFPNGLPVGGGNFATAEVTSDTLKIIFMPGENHTLAQKLVNQGLVDDVRTPVITEFDVKTGTFKQTHGNITRTPEDPTFFDYISLNIKALPKAEHAAS